MTRRRNAAAGLYGCAAAIQTFKWTPRLHEIAAPTFVLWGPTIPAPIRVENRMIAASVRRGEFLAIEGARHLPNVEDAERFNRIVIDWCNRHR